jgi:hypothetical protein
METLFQNETAGMETGLTPSRAETQRLLSTMTYARITYTGTIDWAAQMNGIFSTNDGNDGSWELDRQI